MIDKGISKCKTAINIQYTIRLLINLFFNEP